MPSPIAVPIELSREEREVLEGWTRRRDDCGGVVVAGADRVGGGGWREQHGARCAVGGAPQHGESVAPAVRRVPFGWAVG